MYNLTLAFNGETYTKRPKDVNKGIMAVKPQTLLTDVYVTLKRKEDIRERKLNLTEGKKLFNNDDFRQVFVMNLLLN